MRYLSNVLFFNNNEQKSYKKFNLFSINTNLIQHQELYIINIVKIWMISFNIDYFDCMPIWLETYNLNQQFKLHQVKKRIVWWEVVDSFNNTPDDKSRKFKYA